MHSLQQSEGSSNAEGQILTWDDGFSSQYFFRVSLGLMRQFTLPLNLLHWSALRFEGTLKPQRHAGQLQAASADEIAPVMIMTACIDYSQLQLRSIMSGTAKRSYLRLVHLKSGGVHWCISSTGFAASPQPHIHCRHDLYKENSLQYASPRTSRSHLFCSLGCMLNSCWPLLFGPQPDQSGRRQ